jgi:hypothetical protein
LKWDLLTGPKLPPVEMSTIGAAEIDDHGAVSGSANLEMVTRDQGMGQDDV